MMKRIIECVILLLICITANAQLRIDLEQAKELLLQNSLDIKQSELRQKTAQIDLSQAYNALIPNLGFSLNNQHTMGLNFDQVTGQLVTGNQWTNNASSTLSTNLLTFQGLKMLYNIRMNKISLDLSTLDTKKLKYDLEFQLLTLFFRALINADLYQASIAQVNLSEQQLLQEEAKLNVGKATLLDLAQAKNKLASDQMNATNSKNAYDLSILKLKQLLSLDDETHLEIVASSEKSDKYQWIEKLQVDINQDPYIQLLDKKMEMARVQTKIARTSYFPSISINSSYGTNYSSRRSRSPLSPETMSLGKQMNLNRSLYIGIGISYNIFDRSITSSTIKKSQIATESLNLEKNKVILERQQEYKQARMEFLASLEEQEAIKIAFDASKLNYEAMNERYLVGKSSSIDLYKALTDYNIAEFRTITNHYEVLLKAELLKIWLEDE